MARCFSFLVLFVMLFEGVSFSRDIPATTVDGRKVLLKEDGSWTFYKAPTNTSGTYLKSDESTSVIKVRGDRFQVWFNPLKWRQKKSAEVDKTTFEHKDGDVYAMVIAERLTMAPDALQEMALRNLLKVAPDAEVTYKEERVVNGKKVLCMKMEGTIESVPFIYYGYYYSGKAGIVQFITFTSQNLFPEYEPEMTEFLNGMIISE